MRDYIGNELHIKDIIVLPYGEGRTSLCTGIINNITVNKHTKKEIATIIMLNKYIDKNKELHRNISLRSTISDCIMLICNFSNIGNIDNLELLKDISFILEKYKESKEWG